MADIFVSYSKQDHQQAGRLVAALQAEGYSVWWDASLLSGERFRKTIMTELGRARAVIVIWTVSSTRSDWVQSEAGRAHADRKLIPVKERELSYKDIPPPFDNMHIENLDAREKIMAAVVAQLAKPEAPTSHATRLLAHTRLELFSWLGVLGAAITLTTNLKSLITFADWVRHFLDGWKLLARAFWRQLLFFLPEVPVADAMFFTFWLFLALTFATSFRRQRASGAASWRYVLCIVPLIMIAGIAFCSYYWGDDPFSFVINFGADNPLTRYLFQTSTFSVGAATFFLIVAATVLMPPMILFLLLWIGFRAIGLTPDPTALALRLWRIMLLMGMLIATSYLSLWIQKQGWLVSAK